jgi:hypothetical protein
LEHLLIPSGKSASTNHIPNKSIGSHSLSETDPLAQVLPPRSRRCRHPGLAAAPGPPIVSALLHFPIFCFPQANSFSFFFLRRPQQALERGTETMRNAKNGFVASWFFGSWGTIAVDDGGSQQGLCFSLAEASAKVHLLLYSAPSTRRNSSGTSSLWRARGAGKREKPRLRKPRRCGFVHPFRAVPKVVHRQQAARHKKS